MPRPAKTETDDISRGEAIILLEWLVGTLKHPQPKGGFYHLLHRSPTDVAKEYKVTVTELLKAARRRLAEPA